MMGAKVAIVKDLGLLKLKSEKRRKAFTKVIDRISKLNAERVVAVHGRWQPAGGITLELLDGAMTGRIKREDVPPGIAHHRKGRGKWFAIEAKVLDEIARDLTDVVGDLIKMWDPKYYREVGKKAKAEADSREVKRLADQGK